MTFLAVSDRESARTYYRDVLKLQYVTEDPYALVFELGGGILLRISPMGKVTPAKFTVLGWQVKGIEEKVAELTTAGIEFQKYSFLSQDANGIWASPEGAKIAWFLDPDGNVLSLAEMS